MYACIYLPTYLPIHLTASVARCLDFQRPPFDGVICYTGLHVLQMGLWIGAPTRKDNGKPNIQEKEKP